MKRFLPVFFLVFLGLAGAAFAGDGSGMRMLDELTIKNNNALVALNEETISVVTEVNAKLRVGLKSISLNIPEAQKQYADLALAKLADAEEKTKSAKHMLALAKVQEDVEQKSKMINAVSEALMGVINLHKEIDELLYDLLEKLDLTPPPKKPVKNRGHATG